MANWLGLDVQLTLSLRYLARHRMRTLLVVLSISLGVATLVATQALNATLIKAAEASINPFSTAADLVVVNGQTGMSAKLADDIRAARVPGVQSADPFIIGRVTIPELENRSVLVLGMQRPKPGEGGAGVEDRAREWGMSFRVTAPLAIFSRNVLFAGSELANELEQLGLAHRGFHVELSEKKTPVRLIGVVTVETDSPAAFLGTGCLLMDQPDASAILNPEWPEYVSQINITIEKVADEQEMRRRVHQIRHRLREVVGKRAEVRTVEEYNDSIHDVTAGLQLGFHLGGAGALVIGLFLVYNALSVSVAERRHDIGILRSVGATRRQIGGLFVGEALVLGLLGSGLGVPLGYGLARLVIGPIREIVGDLVAIADTSLIVRPVLVVAALTAGVLATVAASLLPALEAAREEPADAVRRVPLTTGLLRRLVKVAAVGVLLLGCVLCTIYREALPRRSGAFASVVLLMLAAVVATPLLSGFVGQAFQPLFRRLLGLEGRLAADNLTRSARRVGLVIAALTATTALLVQTSGFIASSERAILGWLDHKVSADLYVTGGSALENSALQVPMDETLAEQIKGVVPEAEAVLAARIHQLNFRGRIIQLVAIDTTAFGHDDRRFLSQNLARYPQLRERWPLSRFVPGMMGMLAAAPEGPWLAASVAAARASERRRPQPVLASDNFAALYGIRPGDRFDVPGRDGEVELQLVATVEDYLWNRGIVLADRAWYRETFGDRKVDMYDVFLKGDADAGAAQARLGKWGRQRVLFVTSQTQARKMISEGLVKLYSLAYAQQVLIGLVALLGVVSALFISVLQRTREFGLLRAVGASRAQILRSVLAEAALMGLIGAALGLAFGFVLEWYVIDILLLDESGFLFPLRFPWLASGIVAGAAVVSATLVGLLPAWHATRLRIPEAIAYE